MTIGSCTNFKTKWLTSGGFLSNYNSSECGGHVLEQNDSFTESDWLKKKAHDHPYSLLFSFYQLKIGSIVAPSESMKFPIAYYVQHGNKNHLEQHDDKNK